jgi:hypothetical protein
MFRSAHERQPDKRTDPHELSKMVGPAIDRRDDYCTLRRLRAVVAFALLSSVYFPVTARAEGPWQWYGFGALRASDAPEEGPLAAPSLNAQLQLGVDWFATPRFSAHVHVVGRSDVDDTRRGAAGITEAYVDANFAPNKDRVRVRSGAMFLPTSRENVDSLWETPYTLTSSALNSWFGEEFRPLGVDVSWFHGNFIAGATLFAGNETFGALPAERGWRLNDHWALLGEHIRVDSEYYASVSAENDHRLGWSARGGWRGQHLVLQLTHIDNRSDALEHGELFNWNTQFDIVAADYSTETWTVAAESGWGPTVIIVAGAPYQDDLRASYLLVSRRLPHGQATLRADEFTDGEDQEYALTAAWLWTPRFGPIRIGAEATVAGDDHRVSLEARYRFAH